MRAQLALVVSDAFEHPAYAARQIGERIKVPNIRRKNASDAR